LKAPDLAVNHKFLYSRLWSLTYKKVTTVFVFNISVHKKLFSRFILM